MFKKTFVQYALLFQLLSNNRLNRKRPDKSGTSNNMHSVGFTENK